MNVLLSIKPHYAEAILSGTKKYEFRKTEFKRRGIRRVYLYANGSDSKIVGSFEIESTLRGTPKTIWERCNEHGGITKKDFFAYFEGSKQAFAYRIKNPCRFYGEIDSNSVLESFKTPPQSFYYFPDPTYQDQNLEFSELD
jgi:predicted transcriptional regulator